MNTSKKYLTLLLGGLLLAIGVVYFLLQQPNAVAPVPEQEEQGELLGTEPVLSLYTAGDTSTGALTLTAPFIRAEAGQFNIDVGIDTSGDGTITDDEWQVKDAETYLVQNLKNNFWLQDSALRLKPGDTVAVALTLRKEGSDTLLSTVTTTVTVTKFDIDTLLGFSVPDAHEDWKRGIGLPALVAQTVYADDAPEPVFTERNTPDLQQGPMECAAVSAANSIMSLAGAHDRLENLPKFTGELIEELKKDMQYTTRGISIPNMAAGKNTFAARRNLPIATTIIYAPTKADIEKALRSGAAVELSFSFVRSKSGRANTGHVVTLVGASPSELYVHDSATAEGMDPLRMHGTVQTPKQTFINVLYPLWDGVAYVDAIVIQNWTEATRAETSYTDLDEEASAVEMLVIGGKYFPKAFFRVGEHGACKAAHYHAVNADGIAHGLKSKDATELVSMADPAPDSCGFGKVSEIPVETITITLEQSEQLMRHMPN
jgi:hypothetical protein